MLRIVSVAAAVGLLGTPGWAQNGAAKEGSSAATGISISDAIDKGLKEAGGGFAFHVELEKGSDGLVYSIDVAMEKASVNVILDAKTGAVVGKHDEPKLPADAVGACKIDLKKAIENAGKKRPATVVDAELVLRDGKPVMRVKGVAGGKADTVEVDGATGELVPSEPKLGSYTTTFAVDKKDLVSTGRNRYFVLEPGFRLVLEGKDGTEEARLVITVLEETQVVDGVETRVVEEHESIGGKLVEISRNFFAISKKTNDVFYFGEEVDIYRDGKVVAHEGAWLSGENGAKFGLQMPGTPLIGAKYYQEIAPEVALDRAKVESLSETFETPAGTFKDCLLTKESSALEPGKEEKRYAPDIGLIQDEDLKLVEYGKK